MPNVRQLDTLKSEIPMWRRIISPEHKEDWFASVMGLVLGTFTDFVNVGQRMVLPHWLVYLAWSGWHYPVAGAWRGPTLPRIGKSART